MQTFKPSIESTSKPSVYGLIQNHVVFSFVSLMGVERGHVVPGLDKMLYNTDCPN